MEVFSMLEINLILESIDDVEKILILILSVIISMYFLFDVYILVI